MMSNELKKIAHDVIIAWDSESISKLSESISSLRKYLKEQDENIQNQIEFTNKVISNNIIS